MKKSIYIIMCAAAMTVALSSCGNSDKKFQPKERTSSMSDAQRENAIAAKKAEMEFNLDTLLYSHSVKLSVVPPLPDGKDITEDVATRFANKMLEITSANGIGGINNVPNFALTARLAQTGRTATGTSPQKMVVKYTITWEVANMRTGDVYASATEDITGVGNSFEEANMNAPQAIKNSAKLQKLLDTGSKRIISWYNDNLPTLKKEVAAAEGQQNYALALAMVEAVPQESSAAFAWASEKQPTLLNKMLLQHSADILAEMKGAVTEANGTFSPKVVGYFKMMPVNAPQYKEATALYDTYQKAVDENTKELKIKAEKDAEAQRKLEEQEAKRKHVTQLAQITADVFKTKYQCKANAVAMERDMRRESDERNKSFWGKLGDRIITGIDKKNDEKGW